MFGCTREQLSNTLARLTNKQEKPMNNDELQSTSYGRGLGLEACAVYSQAELDAAVAAERERCAAICEAMADSPKEWAYERAMAVRCAKAIRGEPV
jgi:hypothetical protein